MSKLRAESENVSPTAYATGYLWYRNGLSHPALVTPQGKRLDRGFRALIRATKFLSGVSLEAMLLARHKGIDSLLARAIDEGRVGQVIEVAAGLSARGWRFMQRYGDRITYIETDLPAMAATKRQLLSDAGMLSDRHRVLDIDALADSGPRSLAALAASLDPKVGTAIITEGLMNYLDPDTARGVWARIAKALGTFAHGQYLSDLYLRTGNRSPGLVMFGAILSAFVRGRMHVHFETPLQAVEAMRAAGFAGAIVHETSKIAETRELSATPGADRVQVLEARTF